jgi:carbonic anhydrase
LGGIDRIAPAVSEVGLDDPHLLPLAVRRHAIRTVATLRADPRLAPSVAVGRVAVTDEVVLLDPSERA